MLITYWIWPRFGGSAEGSPKPNLIWSEHNPQCNALTGERLSQGQILMLPEKADLGWPCPRPPFLSGQGQWRGWVDAHLPELMYSPLEPNLFQKLLGTQTQCFRDDPHCSLLHLPIQSSSCVSCLRKQHHHPDTQVRT